MSGKRIFFVLLAVAVVAAGVVFLRGRAKTAPEPGRAAAVEGAAAALPVYTAKIEPRTLAERVTATGSVTADEAVEIVSEVAGKVVAISFEEGGRVRRGDVLLKIDDQELAAQLARAESRASLARAQAARQGQLLASGGTSQQEVDVARSEVQVLEAEAELVRAQLAKTEIRAPFDGIIGLRHVSIGAYLNPSTRVATLQKVDPIKVEFSVAERHLDRLELGAEVTVAVTGVAEPFVGTLYAIEPRIDPDTRTLRLRARAANPGGRVLPGGFATVELPLRTIPDALLVPASAIVAGLNEQTVYVLEDGRAQPRRVETGLRLAREVQIVRGLEPGEVVITSGQLQLRPGVPVQPAVPREDAAGETAKTATPKGAARGT